MNTEVFLSIHSLVGYWPWLDALMIFFAEDAIYLMAFGFVLFFWWHGTKATHRFFVKSGLVAVGVWAVHWVIKFFTAVPRPFVALNFTPLIAEPAEHAFPSGHAAVAFALAVAVWLALKNKNPHRCIVGGIFMFFAILISFSRVYAGVHWPLDVVAGAILGAVGAYVSLGQSLRR